MTNKEAIITGIVATFVGGLLLFFVTKQIDKLDVFQFSKQKGVNSSETVEVPLKRSVPAEPDTTPKQVDRTKDRITKNSPPSSSGSKTPLTQKLRIIEGEVFEACGVSGLFLTTLHSGQGVASLGRKGGGFHNKDGEFLSEYVMLIDKPLSLSINCSLVITDARDVQGHSSFNILIERQNK